MTNTAELTLTDFLLARIAEDEALARDAERAVADLLRRFKPPHAYAGDYYADFARRLFAATPGDPARVLAECAAKRRIVDEHEGSHDCVEFFEPDDNQDCATLRALASVYADHEDFREAWHVSVRDLG